ncbi:Caffeic acid 3-O-methyltransferase [Castilleja foliolosa]|uniref:Caffeic acid 3-O-methyltransferase n=1 Tax=Castilleja foliolosa TaxID=1961234 RepID=A0ABD3EBV0_9LAMI
MDYSTSQISPTSRDEACLFAMQLARAAALPAALKCAIELNLLELMKKAGPAAFVSPADLVAQIPAATNPAAGALIDRILRFLADNKILNCKLKELPTAAGGGGDVERLYSLAPVCEFLTRNDDGVSVAPMLLMCQDPIFMETWHHLKDAVLQGGTPFTKAHGMSSFEYAAKDPRFNTVFNLGMSQQTTLITEKIVELYQGFEGLKSLVDVGGGVGTSLRMILSKHRSIQGINFDLPHVIQDAPLYPGMVHIMGDMFVSVPKGDAIFMKWILHDWSDGDCLKILRNCHESLPKNGKVIIAERIVSEVPNMELSASLAFTIDVTMLAYSPGGKERTEREFHSLAKKAGFKEFRKICCAFGVWIMELYK